MSPATRRGNPVCPLCGSRTRRYIYGLAVIDPAHEDEVVIGGCEIGDDMPTYQCTACGHDF